VRVAGSCWWGSRIGGRAAARAVCLGVRAHSRMLGGGTFSGRSGSEACAARRQLDRSLGRYGAGGGAAADAAPHDAQSRQYRHACALRAPVLGARASVVGRQLAPCGSACGRTFGCWAAGLFRVGAAVRLALLADNQIGASGVTALAAALPQMPSLTTLELGGTATCARCGFLLVGLAARASVVGRQLAACASACGRTVGCWAAGTFSGRSGSEACAARRQPDRSLGRDCAGGGAAADAAPYDARAQRYGHACALRAPAGGARASVVGRQLAACASACGRTVGCWAADFFGSERQ
jgi:hypothetical protein